MRTRVEKKKISAMTVMAPTKAAARMATKPERLTEPAEMLPPRSNITKATPRPAPLLMPKMLGPAKGLRNAVCSISPLTANAPPQRMAVMAWGNRDSRMMKRQEGLALSSPIRIVTTSPMGILTDPITRFSAKRITIASTSMRIIFLLPSFILHHTSYIFHHPSYIVEYLAEMLYLHHLLMVEVFYMLQLPGDMEGNIDG